MVVLVWAVRVVGEVVLVVGVAGAVAVSGVGGVV